MITLPGCRTAQGDLNHSGRRLAAEKQSGCVLPFCIPMEAGGDGEGNSGAGSRRMQCVLSHLATCVMHLKQHLEQHTLKPGLSHCLFFFSIKVETLHDGLQDFNKHVPYSSYRRNKFSKKRRDRRLSARS